MFEKFRKTIVDCCTFVLICIGIFLGVLAILDYVKDNQSKTQIVTYITKADYLVVPDKPIDYWKDEPKEIEANIEQDFNPDLDIIVDYIKSKEGFHSKAYRDGCLIKAKKCPKGKERYSIGYGTLAESKTEEITKKEAEIRLYNHIKKVIWPKMKNVNFTSEEQYYASIDFAYNVGHNAFANKIVDDEGYVDCAKMTEYVYFNGKENEGLKARRFENFLQCVSYKEENI